MDALRRPETVMTLALAVMTASGCGGGEAAPDTRGGAPTGESAPLGGGQPPGTTPATANLVVELDPALDHFAAPCGATSNLTVSRAERPVAIHSSGVMCEPCAPIPPCTGSPFLQPISGPTAEFSWDFLEAHTSACPLAGMTVTCDAGSDRKPVAAGGYRATICLDACDRGACPGPTFSAQKRVCGTVDLTAGVGGTYRMKLR
jgi:hypothetical protein